jgi:hypothetical protein
MAQSLVATEALMAIYATSSDIVTQFAEAQKQIDASGVLKKFDEVQKNFANSSFGKKLAEAQKQIDTSGLSKQFSGVHEHVFDANITKVSSVLEHVNRRVKEDQTRWDEIDRSFDNADGKKVESQAAPIRVPNVFDLIEKSLDARSTRDHEAIAQQSELLASIAQAGKEQHQTMAEIAKLQGMLVEEALENTKMQRTFLYFAALSAAIALFALFVK